MIYNNEQFSERLNCEYSHYLINRFYLRWALEIAGQFLNEQNRPIVKQWTEIVINGKNEWEEDIMLETSLSAGQFKVHSYLV